MNYDVVVDYVIFPKEINWFVERIKELNVKLVYVILMVDEITIKYRDGLRPLEEQMGERSLILLQEFRASLGDKKNVLETQQYTDEDLETIVEDIRTNIKYVVES